MQIGLFGGSFDPPHCGHFQVAEELLKRQVVDEVWYVPVKEHAFGKKMSPVAQRLAMLELMLSRHDASISHQIKIEQYELNHHGVSYTYDTLEQLSNQHPDSFFSFIIGSDNLANFHKWTEIHPMLLKYRFYVYPRAGFAMTPLYKGMIPLSDFPEIAVSSTQIRQQLTQDESVAELVPAGVAEYIQHHHLYE